MSFLQNNFQRYRWWLLLAAGIGGALAGKQVLDALPPGTDLVSAVIALYAMFRNEREQGSTVTAAKVSDNLAELTKQVATNKADVIDLKAVANNHADAIDGLYVWGKPRGYVPAAALLRPALK